MKELMICLVAAFGAEITFALIHRFRFSTIRASTLPTLFFAAGIYFANFPEQRVFQAAFFGATFVGMTDKSRLGWKRVLIASQIFAFCYIFLIPFAQGFGGGLGASAFLSCAIVLGMSRLKDLWRAR
ncbi:MAG: hypothetical protein ACKOX6_05460 [Bdellovibrio sp.]